MKHKEYLLYVLRHKWFVLVAGLKVGAPLVRLLIHDWTKFLLSEWGPYAEWFYGEYGCKFNGGWMYEHIYHEKAYQDFSRAWNYHQKRNKHHWQYWVLNEDSGETRCVKMPEKYALEMLADWMGAGRAISGNWDVAGWYAENNYKIKLHPETRIFIKGKIREYE